MENKTSKKGEKLIFFKPFLLEVIGDCVCMNMRFKHVSSNILFYLFPGAICKHSVIRSLHPTSIPICIQSQSTENFRLIKKTARASYTVYSLLALWLKKQTQNCINQRKKAFVMKIATDKSHLRFNSLH